MSSDICKKRRKREKIFFEHIEARNFFARCLPFSFFTLEKPF